MPPWRQQGRTPRAAHPGRARRLVGARTHTGPAGQGESRVSCRRSSQALALKEIWATNTGSVAASGAATPSPSQLSWSAPSTLRVEPDPQVSLELSAADVWSKGRRVCRALADSPEAIGQARRTRRRTPFTVGCRCPAEHRFVPTDLSASHRPGRRPAIYPAELDYRFEVTSLSIPVRCSSSFRRGTRACRCPAFKVTPRPGSRRESTPCADPGWNQEGRPPRGVGRPSGRSVGSAPSRRDGQGSTARSRAPLG